MNAVILTSDQFEKIEKSYKELKEIITSKAATQSLSDVYYDVQKTCFALSISKRTLQNYRDRGVLSYSQIGGKIYFKVADIEALLEKHYVKASNQKSK